MVTFYVTCRILDGCKDFLQEYTLFAKAFCSSVTPLKNSYSAFYTTQKIIMKHRNSNRNQRCQIQPRKSVVPSYFRLEVLRLHFHGLCKIVGNCRNIKGLIRFVYLNIPNHDENIFAPKRKDCGWKIEDTWFITPLTNKIYSLHPPAITQMVRKLALCRDVDSGMNINMRQM